MTSCAEDGSVRFSAGMRMAATAKCLVSAFVARSRIAPGPDPRSHRRARGRRERNASTAPTSRANQASRWMLRRPRIRRSSCGATAVRVEAALPFASAGGGVDPSRRVRHSVNVRDRPVRGRSVPPRTESGSCSQTVWGGSRSSPFTTVAGLAATATNLGGSCIVGRRHRSRCWDAVASCGRRSAALHRVRHSCSHNSSAASASRPGTRDVDRCPIGGAVQPGQRTLFSGGPGERPHPRRPRRGPAAAPAQPGPVRRRPHPNASPRRPRGADPCTRPMPG
jgi:hypothetical protein